ncbi:MAG: four helix bundle protein [Deltaproteobacteria bacterium]|nr:four helix bundle protein [Deltaproteobacteria bacterium]
MRTCGRGATGGGSNYEEARGAASSADFVDKIRLAKKELREAHFWLRVVQGSSPPVGRPVVSAPSRSSAARRWARRHPGRARRKSRRTSRPCGGRDLRGGTSLGGRGSAGGPRACRRRPAPRRPRLGTRSGTRACPGHGAPRCRPPETSGCCHPPVSPPRTTSP